MEDPGLEGRLGRKKKTPEELAMETDPDYDPYAKGARLKNSSLICFHTTFWKRVEYSYHYLLFKVAQNKLSYYQSFKNQFSNV